LVEEYVKSKEVSSEKEITLFLNKWLQNHKDLEVLSQNAPLVQPLLPLSKALHDLSEQLLYKQQKNSNYNAGVAKELLEKCNSKAHADVELAVYLGLKKMVEL
jgi:hexosaminidase